MKNLFSNIKSWFYKERLIYITSLIVVVLGVVIFIWRVRVVLRDANETALDNYYLDTEYKAQIVKDILDSYRSNLSNISFSQPIKSFLLEDDSYFDSAQEFLKEYTETSSASVIYVLDTSGVCVLSSDETFLNEDYSFRDYYKESILGENYFFPAVGVTSQELGLYFSTPIYSDDEIIGIGVYKGSEEELKNLLESFAVDKVDFVGLESSSGVIFLNSIDSEFYVREDLLQEDIAILETSKQFPLDKIRTWNYSPTEYSAFNEAIYFEDIGGSITVFSLYSLEDYDFNLVRNSLYVDVTSSVNFIKTEIYWLSGAGIVILLSFLYLFTLSLRYYRKQFTIRKELSTARQELTDILERIPVAVIRTTIDGQITYLNKYALKIFGFKNYREAYRTIITSLYVNEKDRKNLLSEININGYYNFDILEMYSKDRSRRIFVRADLWIDEKRRNLEATFMDITEEVISSRRLKAAALSSSDVIWEFDKKGNIIYCSPNVQNVLGYTSDYLEGKNLFDFVQKFNLETAELNFEEIVKEKKDIRNLIIVFRNKNGEDVTLDLNANKVINSVGRLEGYRGSAKNISVLLSQKRELDLLKNAVDQSANTIVITDIDGKIEYVNSYFELLTGYKQDEVLGKTPRVLNSGYHKKSFYKALWDTILSGEVWKGQIRNKKKDGSLFWEETTITPIFDERNKITHFLAIKENITKRKEFEEERAFYQLITESIGDELYLIKNDCTFEFVNKKASESLDFTNEELLSSHLSLVVPDFIENEWKNRIKVLKETKATENVEKVFIDKSKERKIKSLTIQYLKYKDESYLLIIARDITEQKEYEMVEKERTAELEKLNRLTTGREYKIVELQEKVEHLENKLEKFKKYFDSK